MKKILKNAFKWLILVLICYSLMYTGITVIEQGGTIEAIAYKVFNADGDYLDYLESSELEVQCKYYQELADKVFGKVDEEYLTESEINKQLEYNELYKNYPVGFSRVITNVSLYNAVINLHIISLVMGIALGTAIYMILEKDKKGVKVIISLYVVFVILLGFIEGIFIQYVSGENLTLLDKWAFPQTFIFPITVVFILAIIVKILKQKDIAKKLNQKLQEKKK
jgi:hypothetical protein